MRWGLFWVVGAAVSAAAADAQPPVRARAVRDTAATDTTRRALVKWAEPDSAMEALLKRTGYTVTRYQGDVVIFDTRGRNLELRGKPAAVERGQTVVVGDTIIYNDSTQLVVVRGDTNVLRDPSQNAADVVARGSLVYDIARGRGVVTNVSTAVTSGEEWFIGGGRAAFVRDTAGIRPTTFYVRKGSFTTCDLEVPDYHFRASEIKLVSRNLIVARPAVLYIGEVPVMWLPFMFQDIRSGRRSGILSPRFGVSELVRSGATYRRHVEDVGYYFAISDYMDAEVSLDWRSGARGTEGDPGYTRYNGELRYRWLNRFLTGGLSMGHTDQRDHTSNTGVSWNHQQRFSETSSFTANVNYVTNTTIQRRNSFDPRQVLATIQSNVSYQRKLGPASLALGGDRTQHPGRSQVEQTLPTLSIATPALALARWLEWTPSLSFTNRQSLHLDQSGTVGFRFFQREGVPDSVRVDGSSRTTTASFSTPLKIFGFEWHNSFDVMDRENDFPVTITVTDPSDTSFRSSRTFAREFQTDIDWRTGFSLPPLFTGTWNLSPSVSFSNAGGGPFWVRSQFTGGRYVRQAKRPNFGVGVSPTFFRLLPGFGPAERFRHAITSVLTYTYSPATDVSDEYLRATNRSRVGYLGALAQNQLQLQLSHNLEARLRSDRDSSAAASGRKVKVLSMNFSPLTYDFERKRATGKSGFTTTNFSYAVASDLLPSFALNVGYSLFQGDPQSDTAVFKPFRENISATFVVNQQSAIFAAFNRILGRVIPGMAPRIERVEAAPDDALAEQIALTPVAGSASRGRQLGLPSTRGWQASFNFSSQRQRPPVGGQVIDFDPGQICEVYVNPITYEACVIEQQTRPITALPLQQSIGAPFIRTPSRETLQWNTSFNITPKWGATWNTVYDFRAREFASHNVTLQRELHDWRSVFSFTKAPNGNFFFSFFISLIAQPDLKFDYDRQTYRSSPRAR